jgi:predicted DCC family thiol-disulfide oxidoreductase YuxK
MPRWYSETFAVSRTETVRSAMSDHPLPVQSCAVMEDDQQVDELDVLLQIYAQVRTIKWILATVFVAWLLGLLLWFAAIAGS